MKAFQFITPRFLIYASKCLIGLLICYFFYWAFPQYRFYWSIISVLLVISPDDMECRALPIARIKANIIGSLVGLILFIIHAPNLLMMALGVILTLLICERFTLGAATRSALAALIIVLIQEQSDLSWISALERMISVVLGCVVALLITYSFAKVSSFKHSHPK